MDPSEAIFRAGQPLSDGCEFAVRLSPYHDGELEPPAVAEIERHLSSCEACQAELEEIRELSSLASAIGAEGISPFGMKRIHHAIDAQPRFSGLRIAGILAGLAASALVVGSAWLWETPESRPAKTIIVIVNNPPSGADKWMTVASTLEARPLPDAPWEMRDQQMLADAQFSNWMVERLNGSYP